MKINHFSKITAAPVDMEGAVGCTIRVLVNDADGAPHFAMRQFEVAPGGHTPRHTHDFEHEVYVLEGDGSVLYEEEEHPLQPGSFAYVPANELHRFTNTGETPFKFLCLVPILPEECTPGDSCCCCNPH
ncbi:MAG: cupin domain-containing protein [Planctomycetia bacterium]